MLAELGVKVEMHSHLCLSTPPLLPNQQQHPSINKIKEHQKGEKIKAGIWGGGEADFSWEAEEREKAKGKRVQEREKSFSSPHRAGSWGRGRKPLGHLGCHLRDMAEIKRTFQVLQSFQREGRAELRL